MERRVLLAIFLAFIVLYAWQALFVKPVPKPAATSTSSSASSASGRGSTAVPSRVTGAASPAPTATSPPPIGRPAAAPVVSEPTERDVRVETRDVIAVFTNRGARLK